MKYRLDDLTSAEFKGIQPENPIMLLPMGTFEDQGAHAPMGDFRSVSMMAELIANAAGSVGTHCLAAPFLPFGSTDHFASTPGAIALSPQTLSLVLEETLQNLIEHGMSRLIIINSHRGNDAVIRDVTRTLRQTGGPLVPCFPIWRIAQRIMARHIGFDSQRFGHGGEPMASIGLALRGKDMRFDLVVPPELPGTALGLDVIGFGMIEFEEMPIDVPLSYRTMAPNSAFGDATQADAKLGLQVVAELVSLGARLCVHMGSVL